MDGFRILKIQTPALRLKRRGRELRFGAHNFLAVLGPDGRVVREIHGIARGPDGAQLRLFGGIVPFRREYIWGETYGWRTGFYDPDFPQVELMKGGWGPVERKLRAAARVEAEVNRRHIRYPWPAFVGGNSNAYCATVIAGMGLTDRRAAGQLWAPSSHRLLLPRPLLAEIAAEVREPA